MKKAALLGTFIFILICVATAQDVEMADGLRSEGKIYVVVLVLSIIVAGLFGYLFYLDKKVSNKEKSGK